MVVHEGRAGGSASEPPDLAETWFDSMVRSRRQGTSTQHESATFMLLRAHAQRMAGRAMYLARHPEDQKRRNRDVSLLHDLSLIQQWGDQYRNRTMFRSPTRRTRTPSPEVNRSVHGGPVSETTVYPALRDRAPSPFPTSLRSRRDRRGGALGRGHRAPEVCLETLQQLCRERHRAQSAVRNRMEREEDDESPPVEVVLTRSQGRRDRRIYVIPADRAEEEENSAREQEKEEEAEADQPPSASVPPSELQGRPAATTYLASAANLLRRTWTAIVLVWFFLFLISHHMGNGITSVDAIIMESGPSVQFVETVEKFLEYERQQMPPPPLSHERGHTPINRRAFTSSPQGGNPLPALSHDQRKMLAYDCTEPQNVTSVNLMDHKEIRSCSDEELQRQQQKVKYLLVQKADNVPVRIRKCKATATRLMWVCGSASHSAIAPNEIFINNNWVISGSECDKIFETKKYCAHGVSGWKKKCKTVRTNGITHLRFRRSGNTSFSTNDVLCTGQRMPAWFLRSVDHAVESVVAYDYVEIEAREVEAVIADFSSSLANGTLDENPTNTGTEILEMNALLSGNGNEALAAKEAGDEEIDVDDLPDLPPEKPVVDEGKRIIVRRDEVMLHCYFSTHKKGSCVTAEHGTFAWPQFTEQQMCPYFKLKEVSGINLQELRDLDGQTSGGETFLSDDNNMIRLKKKGPQISGCGSAVLQPTEFPQLYLSADLKNKALNRQLDPREASAFLHATVSDLYIYEKTQDQLASAVLGLQRHQCRQERERNIRAYATRLARQKAVADGDTAHLGDGVFLTASGDLAYMYRCRPITVTAIAFPGQCYNALPVELSEQDQEYLAAITEDIRLRPQSNLGKDPDAPQEKETTPKAKDRLRFFLEPRSHRLVPIAAPMACVPQFAPVYRNKHGRWIQLTDVGMRPSSGPRDPEANLPGEFFEVQREKLPNISQASIYPASTIRQTIRFLVAPALILTTPSVVLQDITDYLKGDTSGFPNGFPNLNPLLQQLPSPLSAAGLGWMESIWSFMKAYGRLCTVIIGTWVFYTIGLYFIGVWIRLTFYKRTLPWCFHIFLAFFPELANLLCFGKYDPDGPQGPCHHVVTSFVKAKENRGKKALTREDQSSKTEASIEMSEFLKRDNINQPQTQLGIYPRIRSKLPGSSPTTTPAPKFEKGHRRQNSIHSTGSDPLMPPPMPRFEFNTFRSPNLSVNRASERFQTRTENRHDDEISLTTDPLLPSPRLPVARGTPTVRFEDPVAQQGYHDDDLRTPRDSPPSPSSPVCTSASNSTVPADYLPPPPPHRD